MDPRISYSSFSKAIFLDHSEPVVGALSHIRYTGATSAARRRSDRKIESFHPPHLALSDPCTNRVGSRQTTRDRRHALASIRVRHGPSSPGEACAYTRDRPPPGHVR